MPEYDVLAPEQQQLHARLCDTRSSRRKVHFACFPLSDDQGYLLPETPLSGGDSSRKAKNAKPPLAKLRHHPNLTQKESLEDQDGYLLPQESLDSAAAESSPLVSAK